MSKAWKRPWTHRLMHHGPARVAGAGGDSEQGALRPQAARTESSPDKLSKKTRLRYSRRWSLSVEKPHKALQHAQRDIAESTTKDDRRFQATWHPHTLAFAPACKRHEGCGDHHRIVLSWHLIGACPSPLLRVCFLDKVECCLDFLWLLGYSSSRLSIRRLCEIGLRHRLILRSLPVHNHRPAGPLLRNRDEASGWRR